MFWSPVTLMRMGEPKKAKKINFKKNKDIYNKSLNAASIYTRALI